MEKDIETKKLELEERRLNEELQLKRMELDLQREQFEASQQSKGYKAQIFSPIGAAVIVGILGLLGTAASGLFNSQIERDKQQANLLLKISEESDEVKRARSLLFYAQGGYLEFPPSYIDYLRKQAQLEENDKVPPPMTPISQSSFETLVDIPATINQGLTAAKTATLMSILGVPCELTPECSPVTNPNLESRIVTEDVGPFRVAGLKPAVEALRRIFADVKQHEPELYKQIGTAGMLCCRKLRGGQAYSNHSWGTAIDLKIGGSLAPSGQSKTQSGLVSLYPYFNKEKFFWGAEHQDSLHFDASEELIREWKEKGMLNPR